MRKPNSRGDGMSPVLTNVTGCTIQLDDGQPCDQRCMPTAPFSICERHLVRAYRHVARLMATQHVAEPNRKGRPDRGTASKGYGMNGWPSVVYYARIGEHIKIGHTKNLAERMKWYPPSTVILALEPGDLIVERSRQWKFDHLLDAREEWFKPGVDLMKHIEDLAVAGLPVRSC